MHPGQIPKDSPLLERVVDLLVDQPGTGQAGVTFDQYTPGYPFLVKQVEVIAQASTASADVDVQIGGTSVLSSPVADPAANTLVTPTLAAKDNRKGSDTDTLDLVITTDGTGNLTVCRTRVVIRPHPAGGEPGGWKAPPGQG